MDAEQKTQIVSLFVDAANDLAARFSNLHIPQTYVTTESVVVSAERGSWQASTAEVESNILRDPGPLYKLSPLFSEAIIERLLACAGIIASDPDANLPYSSGFRGFSLYINAITDVSKGNKPVSFETDPAGWTLRSVVLPALTSYLTELPSVSSVDLDSAQTAVEEMVAFSQAETIQVRSRAFIAGIDLPESKQDISAGPYRIQALTTSEQSRLFNSNDPWGSAQFDELPTASLDALKDHPRREPLAVSPEPLQPIVWALHLLGYRPSGLSIQTATVPRWAMNGRWTSPINSMPRMVQEWKELTEDSLREAARIARRLEDQSIAEPRSVKTMALHRFFSGMARANAVDALIDFTVSLESLLLPYDESTRNSELSYRFRMHGAHYLSSAVEDRMDTMRRLRTIYETRSKLVHGGNYPDPTSIHEVRDHAYKLSQKGLLRAIDEGFPTAEAFNRMILGL